MSGNGSQKRRIFVVANGKKAGDEDLRSAIMKLRDEGHDIDVRVTWEHKDVARYVEEALSIPEVTAIVAAGGDGTVNEVASALIDLDAPEDTALAVVPLGTANDFATSLGIPEDPEHALQLALADTASAIDIGLVNDKVFINVATGGFGAEVTESTDTGLKDSIGGAAYILTGLTSPQKLAAKDATAKMPLDALVHTQEDEWVKLNTIDHPDIKQAKSDGTEYAEFDGKLLVLAVGNARQAGGGVQLCPDALVDDGLLDVTYILNPSLDQVPQILLGLQDDKKLESPTGRLRCSWLEVECPDELQINRDGEPMRSTKYEFKVLPNRLALHMPHTKLVSEPGGKHSPRQRFSRQIKSQAARRNAPASLPKRLLSSTLTKRFLTAGALFGAGCYVGMRVQRQRMPFR